ncbi:Smr/MutS family protein [Halorhodospira halophila]|uniref:Smr protein/MutS2 n=1 Tax=Halorhodospira halophila (strain DSM 244 / SL1) TaxID=349124 RepID=A1WWY7_HALHL|nr:Smr/MutS family protein [Halorhodospira halophila]ABM62199.1 Smr protein/MutS2 [Halorhodospira halophila SL1]MBK1729174.1 DNA mismatch repair protein MutS [Halorhodospira halophila]
MSDQQDGSGDSRDPADETALFRQAMADVRRYDNDQTERRPPPPPPRPIQREADERRVVESLLEPPPDPAEVETGEELLYYRAGVQRRVLRQLRRGHYPPAAQLDLHGLTRREAYRELTLFLAHAAERNHRCVRIIHGKGRGSQRPQPVLKVAVDHWLRRRDDVLAFASAPESDGGTGAVYVLLRKPGPR